MPALTIGQLRAENSWASHPLYRREDWKQEAQEGNTQRGYWDWVEAMIEQDADQTRIQSDVPDSIANQSLTADRGDSRYRGNPMGDELGDMAEPGSAELQEAFRQTPEWKAYHAAHLAWRKAHFEYFHAPASKKAEARAKLNRDRSEQQCLLAICRAMPEHLKAFGW